MKRNIIRIILLLLITCWMFMVFGFSSAEGEASTSLSMKVAKIFVNNEINLDFVENIIRKIAHLTEYAIGGILVYLFFLTFDLNARLQFICSFVFVTLYAITDEIHQLMVPGRCGKIIDVYIDVLGILIGLCSVLLIIKIIESFTNKEIIKL